VREVVRRLGAGMTSRGHAISMITRAPGGPDRGLPAVDPETGAQWRAFDWCEPRTRRSVSGRIAVSFIGSRVPPSVWSVRCGRACRSWSPRTARSSTPPTCSPCGPRFGRRSCCICTTVPRPPMARKARTCNASSSGARRGSSPSRRRWRSTRVRACPRGRAASRQSRTAATGTISRGVSAAERPRRYVLGVGRSRATEGLRCPDRRPRHRSSRCRPRARRRRPRTERSRPASGGTRSRHAHALCRTRRPPDGGGAPQRGHGRGDPVSLRGLSAHLSRSHACRCPDRRERAARASARNARRRDRHPRPGRGRPGARGRDRPSAVRRRASPRARARGPASRACLSDVERG